MADQPKKYRYFKVKGAQQISVFIAGAYFNRESVHRFEDGKVPADVQLYKNQGILAETTESDWLKYAKSQKQIIANEEATKPEKPAKPAKEKESKAETPVTPVPPVTDPK